MNGSAPAHDRFPLLLEKYLDGALSAAERVELRAYLTEDRACQTDFVETLANEVAVRTLIARERRNASAPPQARRRRPVHGRPVRVRAWTWRITAVAAGILLLLGVFLGREVAKLRVDSLAVHVATLTPVRGAVAVLRPSGAVSIRAAESLSAGDRVETRGAASAAFITYSDGTRLELAANTTAAVLGQAGESKRVCVDTGELTAEVVPQPRHWPMRVMSPHTEVLVVGTRFSLAVGTAATRVDLTRGELRVLNKQTRQSVALHEGYYALVGQTTVVAARPAFDRAPPEAVARAGKSLQALYLFRDGGTIVRDVAGAGAPLDLTVRAPQAVRPLPGGGLELRTRCVLASDRPATRIIEACRASDEISIEAWITPADPEQPGGPARIVTCSPNPDVHNFTLGQIHIAGLQERHYIVRLHGEHWQLTSYPRTAAPSLSHVVFVRRADRAATLYVDGHDRTYKFREGWQMADWNGTFGSDFAAWNADYPLVLGGELGDEPGNLRSWLGSFHLVAIYSRALSPEDVALLFRQGAPAGP
ncbi:MAG: FecR domain-containing protein [Kiritimatiellae bacterium]|nr:FecR domain-containing protein [Kiritimatiellia bacterium]